MKKSGAIYALALLVLLLTLVGTPVRADDVPKLEISAAVMEKLEALGTVFNLDWGLYRNT